MGNNSGIGGVSGGNFGGPGLSNMSNAALLRNNRNRAPGMLQGVGRNRF